MKSKGLIPRSKKITKLARQLPLHPDSTDAAPAYSVSKDEVQTDLFDFSIIKPFRNEELITAIRSLEHAYSGETV